MGIELTATRVALGRRSLDIERSRRATVSIRQLQKHMFVGRHCAATIEEQAGASSATTHRSGPRWIRMQLADCSFDSLDASGWDDDAAVVFAGNIGSLGIVLDRRDEGSACCEDAIELAGHDET